MNINEFNIRPSSGFNTAFSVYWHFDINKAKEVFSGTKDDCYERLNLISKTIETVQNKIRKELSIDVFDYLNSDDEEIDPIVKINIGALCFEFTARDFADGHGMEVNCECFILGKDTGYAFTEKKRDGKDGIPYDDEYCTGYYVDEMKNDYEKTINTLIDEIKRFILGSEERTNYANATELTWDNIKKGD